MLDWNASQSLVPNVLPALAFETFLVPNVPSLMVSEIFPIPVLVLA